MARRHAVSGARAHGPSVLARASPASRRPWYCYLVNPALPERIRKAAGPLYTLLDNKYYFDRFNDWFFAGGFRRIGTFLSDVGDRSIIDGFFVNGSARTVALGAALLRHMQSGYVYHYAFTMIVGLFALLSWWTLR